MFKEISNKNDFPKMEEEILEWWDKKIFLNNLLLSEVKIMNLFSMMVHRLQQDFHIMDIYLLEQ